MFFLVQVVLVSFNPTNHLKTDTLLFCTFLKYHILVLDDNMDEENE